MLMTVDRERQKVAISDTTDLSRILATEVERPIRRGSRPFGPKALSLSKGLTSSRWT
jgi:hypothetical protein